MAARYKRSIKNFFIKKELQGKISLLVFLTVIGCCFLFFVLFAFLSRDTLTFSYSDSVVQVGRTPWMLLKDALMANWLFVLIGGTLLILVVIVSTHRVAGPLYRFEQTLADMIDGDLSSNIHLRGKDEGKDLAGKINTFNTTLSGRMKEMQRSNRAISDLIARCEALDIAKISPEEAEVIMKAIKNHNSKIRTQLDFFTLKDD